MKIMYVNCRLRNDYEKDPLQKKLKTKDRSIYNSIISMLDPRYRELSKHYLDFFKKYRTFPVYRLSEKACS